MIRIIAGKFKGHKLKSGLDRPGFRPTKDRVKESLFSILGDLSEKTVLDLFAGSGNLGFEALSRGARRVTFVENNFQQTKIIQENADKIHAGNSIEIIKQNVLSVLENSTIEFDLILADPPYQFRHFDRLVSLLVERYCNTEIVLESSKDFDISTVVKEINSVEKVYGNTKITIIKG